MRNRLMLWIDLEPPGYREFLHDVQDKEDRGHLGHHVALAPECLAPVETLGKISKWFPETARCRGSD
jgi:hypothetical protein